MICARFSQAFARSLDLARHAEKLGYRRYWVAEHHSMPGIASAATAVVIGHIAQGTSTIRVGSEGIMLLNHSPLVIAEQFGTFESLYSGRIDPWGGFSAQLAGNSDCPSPQQAILCPTTSCLASNFIAGVFALRRTSTGPARWSEINVFAADTDREAERLATSHFQAHSMLARGIPVELSPPAKSLEEVWKGQFAESSFLRGSIIGSPSTVETGLRSLVEMTNADELIIHSMIFDHEARRRSYEIVWQVAGSMAPKA